MALESPSVLDEKADLTFLWGQLSQVNGVHGHGSRRKHNLYRYSVYGMEFRS